MRPQPKQIMTSGAALLATLALAGCGTVAKAKAKPFAVPRIPFRSAAIDRHTLPARFTCRGQDISPPVEWGAVPRGVESLMLFLVGYTRTAGQKVNHLSVEWAVAGLNPDLHRLRAGELPPGAYLGVASDGRRQRYSLCPKKPTLYEFELYGAPGSNRLVRDFGGYRALTSLLTPTSPTHTTAYGNFYAIYERKR
jgi:phosphatidylethanolamine-binding protein (PEBP) family uncharacterized protein